MRHAVTRKALLVAELFSFTKSPTFILSPSCGTKFCLLASYDQSSRRRDGCAHAQPASYGAWGFWFFSLPSESSLSCLYNIAPERRVVKGGHVKGMSRTIGGVVGSNTEPDPGWLRVVKSARSFI